MAIKQLYPGIRPTLNLDFVNSKQVDPRVTFTRASQATYYNEKGQLVTADINQPRIDFDPVTGVGKGLLIEEARTNLLMYSEDFRDTVGAGETRPWANNRVTMSANSAVAPNGANTADAMIETTDTGTHAVSLTTASALTSGSSYTLSVFVKPASGVRNFVLGLGGAAYATSVSGTFILSALTADASSDALATITPAGGGWYRCALSATAQAAGSALVVLYLYNSTSSYAGDGTSGLYIWGAQLEEGSFPTSYIPTTTAAATRAADDANIQTTAFSDMYGTSSGTLFFTASSQQSSFSSIGDRAHIVTIALDGSNFIEPMFISSGLAVLSKKDGGEFSSSNAIISKTIVTGQKYTGAVAFNNDTVSVALDGSSAIGAPRPFNTRMATFIRLGNARSVQVRYLDGHITRLAYWPQRLPNATLQQLTK
jgi:hypothetical protein